MDYTKLRALTSLFSMLNQAVRNVLNYNHNHPDFPMLVCTSGLSNAGLYIPFVAAALVFFYDDT